VTGVLVEPHSASAWKDSISKLWLDADLRGKLGEQAGCFAADRCSDEAAGRALKQILDEVAAENNQHLSIENHVLDNSIRL
jgi:hypothetical protein